MRRCRASFVTRLSLVALIACCAALTAVPVSRAEEEASGRTVALEDWLVLGPVPLVAPAGGELELDEIASVQRLDLEDAAPIAGDLVELPDGTGLAWSAAETGGGAVSLPDVPEGSRGALIYLATYVTTDRFVKATLTVESGGSAEALWGGSWKAVAPDKGLELAIRTGKRPLVLEVRLPAESENDTAEDSAESDGSAETEAGPAHDLSRLGASLKTGDTDAVLSSISDPTHALRLEDVLTVEAAGGVSLSADGSRVAISLSDPAVPADERRHWIEIRDADSGALLRDSGAASWRQFEWAPEGAGFAYVNTTGETAELWVDDGAGRQRKIAEGLEKLGGIRWAPDGRSLFCSMTVEKKTPDDSTEKLARRVRSLPDRQEGFRDKSYLYQVALEGGAKRRLTAGDLSTALQDVRSDGAKLLFTRNRTDDAKHPFHWTEIWELDLAGLGARMLTEVPFSATAAYAPGEHKLLVVGAPSAFGEEGVALDHGVTPNDYDQQLYLFDPDSGEAMGLTSGFDPSVLDVQVSQPAGRVTLLANAGEFQKLYSLELATRSIEPLGPENVDVIRAFALSTDGTRLAWIGSSADLPQRVEASGFPMNPTTVRVLEPGREEHLELGTVEDWDFTTEDGTTLEGRVHYPPDFDPEGRYPAIVYYYGGTAPVYRDFGGRYPKNVWAGNGYVVYVLQPSGTYGYGQEFSARHVNDWGDLVAGEIIAATEGFLEAHDFVDPERVGCIGASYGGFMTQLLLTRTDMFDAAVSHAGISSIASYWGEGWWGYVYNAVSASGSYPWNRPDVYIDRSALFHADAINTPLLLLHGDADTNVPPGESRQMFTALRVLGKPVELVEIPGENHLIMQLDRRRHWAETIIAWFDRELRDRPAYWEHLYPEP